MKGRAGRCGLTWHEQDVLLTGKLLPERNERATCAAPAVLPGSQAVAHSTPKPETCPTGNPKHPPTRQRDDVPDPSVVAQQAAGQHCALGIPQLDLKAGAEGRQSASSGQSCTAIARQLSAEWGRPRRLCCVCSARITRQQLAPSQLAHPTWLSLPPVASWRQSDARVMQHSGDGPGPGSPCGGASM